MNLNRVDVVDVNGRLVARLTNVVHRNASHVVFGPFVAPHQSFFLRFTGQQQPSNEIFAQLSSTMVSPQAGGKSDHKQFCTGVTMVIIVFFCKCGVQWYCVLSVFSVSSQARRLVYSLFSMPFLASAFFPFLLSPMLHKNNRLATTAIGRRKKEESNFSLPFFTVPSQKKVLIFCFSSVLLNST